MKEKTIGIMGGMGPLATQYLFAKIIELTPAKQDQDHLHVIIDSNPKTPDRTESILNGDDQIIVHLKESAKTLEGAGADCIAIACNTSHAYIDEIRGAVGIPVLDMISAAVESIDPGDTPVGILATDGTLKKDLYQKYGESKNIQWLTLDGDEQKTLMGVIYKIKAGEQCRDLSDTFKGLLSSLEGKGAQAAVLGCTELSLFKQVINGGIKLIDPVEIIALEAIKFSGVDL